MAAAYGRRGARTDPIAHARLGLVDGDPGRVPQEREAEHAPSLREVAAERVRCRDDLVARDQPQRFVRDPVVRPHVCHVRSELLRTRQRAPRRGAPEHVVRHECRADDEQRDPLGPPRPPPRQPRGTEDRRSHEPRDRRSGVVEVDGCLRVRRRQEVQADLRQRDEERERREERKARERQQERGQVLRVPPLGHGRRDGAGVRSGRLEHAAGRTADLVVAAVEARRPGRAEVRDHEAESERRDGDACDGDRRSRQHALSRERVPEPERCEREPDVLLRRDGEQREDRERDQPLLVEVPEGEEEERRCEGHGVELAQRHPLHGGKEQVRDRKAGSRSLGAEVGPREPEDGQRAERDDERLGDEEQARARPQQPERGEEDEDRVEVGAESDELLAAEARHLERIAMGRGPDGLHHVAEVEAAGVEGAVAEQRERRRSPAA